MRARPRRTYRVIDLVQQTGDCHEAVANRLDFVETMLGGDALENEEERIEPQHARQSVTGFCSHALPRIRLSVGTPHASLHESYITSSFEDLTSFRKDRG